MLRATGDNEGIFQVLPAQLVLDPPSETVVLMIKLLLGKKSAERKS